MKLYMTLSLALATASITLMGCNENPNTSTTDTTSATYPETSRLNTGDNATAMNQGNDRADLEATQAIRKAMMADDALSAEAKNVAVITNNGDVTLRGVVKSVAEEQSIVAKARAWPGTHRVDDALEVKPK